MNYILQLLLAIALFFGATHLDAICKSPSQGPQGPFGTNYIDSFNNTPQPLISSVPSNVVFPFNSAGPVGITKSPIFNDIFTVLQSGVYLISFAVNATSEEISFPINSLSLTLKVNGIPVPPIPIALGNSFVGGTGQLELTGQTLLTLSGGSFITLEVLGVFNESPIIIDSALINIIQVASAP